MLPRHFLLLERDQYWKCCELALIRGHFSFPAMFVWGQAWEWQRRWVLAKLWWWFFTRADASEYTGVQEFLPKILGAPKKKGSVNDDVHKFCRVSVEKKWNNIFGIAEQNTFESQQNGGIENRAPVLVFQQDYGILGWFSFFTPSVKKCEISISQTSARKPKGFSKNLVLLSVGFFHTKRKQVLQRGRKSGLQ